MTRELDLQHVSYAVHDAQAAARRLCSEAGAIPMAGEELPDFRYVLMHLGGEAGGYLELIEPSPGTVGGTGFADRFLAKHGEGPHHLTWMVPDLHGCVEEVRRLGFTVVGEDYTHSSWEEAFVMPHPSTGCVMQLARSDREYPTGAELAAGVARLDDLPASAGALEAQWWHPLRSLSRGPRVEWGGVRMRSSDPALLHSLFTDVLGGVADTGACSVYRWPGGSLTVHEDAVSGVEGVILDGVLRSPHSLSSGQSN